jgi:hypothetical protein
VLGNLGSCGSCCSGSAAAAAEKGADLAFSFGGARGDLLWPVDSSRVHAKLVGSVDGILMLPPHSAFVIFMQAEILESQTDPKKALMHGSSISI